MILETERLILRPIGPKDALSVLAYRSDRIANQFQGWIPQKLQDVHDLIGRVAGRFNQPDTWFQMVVVRKTPEKVIGDIGIHFLAADHKQVELGCTLAREEQGRGYATEALRKVIDHLFRDLNKHRIIASIDPENSPSLRLFERLGFRKEAHFKESIWMNDSWVDDIIYAVLNKEWK